MLETLTADDALDLEPDAAPPQITTSTDSEEVQALDERLANLRSEAEAAARRAEEAEREAERHERDAAGADSEAERAAHRQKASAARERAADAQAEAADLWEQAEAVEEERDERAQAIDRAARSEVAEAHAELLRDAAAATAEAARKMRRLQQFQERHGGRQGLLRFGSPRRAMGGRALPPLTTERTERWIRQALDRAEHGEQSSNNGTA